jgi:DNA-binding response OmpR family regulator
MEKKITLIGQVGNFFVKELSKCLGKEGFSIEVIDHPQLDDTELTSDVYLVDVPDNSSTPFSSCKKLQDDAVARLAPMLLFIPPSPKALQIEGYRIGADDVFEKPVDLNLLIERILSLLRRREMWAEMGRASLSES